ncbi:TIGR00266 family protein [Laspinema sp. A4]|uniref:TIGR00266 family protein n=1 Tax=Laspinema sp. D2d TaxID=2953686 RepID=UPI0021BB8F96|nr:TIGR00266 family protein [Laspinema sp. D2d]MCT7984514.1 TIGR00266 family protein [Laspinema sp. D2d]
MNVNILHQPDCAIAHLTLKPGEDILAEAGSMIAMNGDMQVSTTLRRGKGGGILGGLKRTIAGESLFLSVFRAPSTGGEIFLSPKMLGDIFHYKLRETGLIVQATSYLACSAQVILDIGVQGFKSFFSGESFFWLDISGRGDLLLSSFGAIYEILVEGEYIVDTGHIVAFEKTLTFEITKPPGSNWVSAWLSGEGVVCRFKGRGRLFCQTHNPQAFGQLIGSQLSPRTK